MSYLNQGPASQGNPHQIQQPLLHHSTLPNQLKNHHLNGSLDAGNSLNQFKLNPLPEKQLLQPSAPQGSHYSSYNSTKYGLMPIDENIGTKEQRRERKRKHNVKELFSTKRPRGSEKLSSSKSRLDKKSATDSISDPSVSSPDVIPHSPGNGHLMGVDPMLPANPFKVEGLPSINHDVNDKAGLDSLTEIKKKLKRLKKKQNGEDSVL